MTARRLRTLLYVSAACLMLAAAGVVVWAFYAAPQQNTSDDSDGSIAPRQLANEVPNTPTLPSRDALLTLADKPLRQQLFDPPPATPVAPPPPPSLPGVELISTVLPSNGDPSAWVRESAQGNTPRKVGIGDVLGPDDNPVTITAIEPDRLLVEHNGETKPITRNAPSSGGRR